MPTLTELATDFTIALTGLAALISAACLVVGHSPLKVLGLSLAMGG